MSEFYQSLSEAAHRRIDHAFADADALRHATLARIQARCHGYDWDEQALVEWSEYRRAAVYKVLALKQQEFAAIGITEHELRNIMRDELDAAAYSLELTHAEKRAVSSGR
jgi:hypothetical protein